MTTLSRRELPFTQAVWLSLMVAAAVVRAGEGPKDTFDVRDYGAKGDGAMLDTAAINKAMDACAKAGGGQVLLPPGRYLSGTVHLRSHVTLFLAAGARLLGTTNLAQYQQPSVPSYMPEARWGKWHRGLLVGDDVEDVTVCGQGVLGGR